MPQPLSSKEASLFRQVVKNYESKQHKKGIKAADQILKKSPNHGDTQAMKALILNTIGQSDEAFPLAKKALQNDMKSHVCWHVYGLLWRSHRNYEEAIKAYKFALRLEPDSPQILRDLSLLQIQMRDYHGYVDSRRTMLQKRQTLRQNWTALAIAHHLAGDLKAAENVLALYEGTLKSPPPKIDVEHNEAVLYKNTIIAEMGELGRAMEHLDSVEQSTLDRTAIMELRADYLLRLDKRVEAETAYRALLERNPEYRNYYSGLEKALQLDHSNRPALKELYGSYAQKHDRIDAARRIPLDFLEGDDFKEAADRYLRRMLHKGVPSTFNNVKSLYTNPFKRKTLQDLIESYTSEKQVNGITNPEQSPSLDHDRFVKSTHYFLAQHYNYKITRDLKKAMSHTEKLIELSPKTYDYQMNRARILKHMGHLSGAATTMDRARELDLRDRYINTKCAKYQLRNDDNDAALKTMSKFTRNEVVGGTLGDLIEMQALWYLTEDGEAHARRGRLGLALKRFHTIHNIFETWQEDQFDFHSFSLRKGQIRAYVDMIRWEDRLREHPFYSRAAIGATRVYLHLHNHPEKTEAFTDGINGSADPKALKKARQQEERRELERREADRKAAAKKNNLGQDGEPKKTDEDPKGKKLLETKDPLGEATKFMAPLLELGERDLETQQAGFEVYLRREKYYLALKCLLASFAIDPAKPNTHTQAIQFLHKLQPNSKSQAILTLAHSSLPEPYNTPCSSLTSLNDSFLAQHPHSAPHTYAYIRARAVLDPSPSSQAWNQEQTVECLKRSEGGGLSMQQAVDGLRLLRELGAERGALDTALEGARAACEDSGGGGEVLERAAFADGVVVA